MKKIKCAVVKPTLRNGDLLAELRQVKVKGGKEWILHTEFPLGISESDGLKWLKKARWYFRTADLVRRKKRNALT